jgi:hypothetical protein
VQFAEIKYPGGAPHDDTERGHRIAWLVGAVLRQAAALTGCQLPTLAMESLPTHAAYSLVPGAELHGHLRGRCAIRSQALLTCPQYEGRMLLLGKVPNKGIKELVERVIASLPGCSGLTGHQADALVVLNWAMSELGAPCLRVPQSVTDYNSAQCAATGSNRATSSRAKRACRDLKIKRPQSKSAKKSARKSKPRS